MFPKPERSIVNPQVVEKIAGKVADWLGNFPAHAPASMGARARANVPKFWPPNMVKEINTIKTATQANVTETHPEPGTRNCTTTTNRNNRPKRAQKLADPMDNGDGILDGGEQENGERSPRT